MTDIRPADTGDEAALGELGAQLVAEHYRFDPLRFLPPRPDTPRGYGRFLISQIGDASRLLCVAERDGRIVGYVFAGLEGFDYMTLRGPAGMIYDLIVAADSRRQGIGQRLLRHAFAALRAKGAPRVLLMTADQNHGAQAVFAAAGFRPTMIEMTRELSDADED